MIYAAAAILDPMRYGNKRAEAYGCAFHASNTPWHHFERANALGKCNELVVQHALHFAGFSHFCKLCDIGGFHISLHMFIERLNYDQPLHARKHPYVALRMPFTGLN
jgi:hypothetical protein